MPSVDEPLINILNFIIFVLLFIYTSVGKPLKKLARIKFGHRSISPPFGRAVGLLAELLVGVDTPSDGTFLLLQIRIREKVQNKQINPNQCKGKRIHWLIVDTVLLVILR